MNLFERINDIFPNITGWCSIEKAQFLASQVLMSRPGITCEIGVWGGKSAIPIALAHKEIGSGKLIAIDPWMASASVEGQVHPADKNWWSRQENHDAVKSHFIHHVNALRLTGFVEIRAQKSDDVAPPTGVGLLHLDGNHGDQAYRDIERFAPHVILGGIVVVDDIGWSGMAVNRAIEKLNEIGFKEVFQVKGETNVWGVYKRVK